MCKKVMDKVDLQYIYLSIIKFCPPFLKPPTRRQPIESNPISQQYIYTSIDIFKILSFILTILSFNGRRKESHDFGCSWWKWGKRVCAFLVSQKLCLRSKSQRHHRSPICQAGSSRVHSHGSNRFNLIKSLFFFKLENS